MPNGLAKGTIIYFKKALVTLADTVMIDVTYKQASQQSHSFFKRHLHLYWFSTGHHFPNVEALKLPQPMYSYKVNEMTCCCIATDL
eukprot:scaffold87265_cov33-Prasinocladus_malaysianus.AAC.1